MRYLDSGTRSQDQALAYWIDKEVAASASYLRFQTGYFSIRGLSYFDKIIKALVDTDRPISAVIGSNDRDTTKDDINSLIDFIGCPRASAQACIVSYSNGLFHPKVIHLTRTDGSQLAYVGSANLTVAGVAAQNIEAGLLLDTNEGDPAPILSEIAVKIDSWFNKSRPEAFKIKSHIDIQKLTDDGILGVNKPKRHSQTAGSGEASSIVSRPSLQPLVGLTSLGTSSPSTKVTGSSLENVTSAITTVIPIVHGDEILIAEIGRGERWKQANFPKSIMRDYFGVDPVASDYIKLHEVESNGAAGNVADTKVVNVKSQNYRIELSAVAGISYPTFGKPIGLFKKVGPKEFRYRVFMPTDPNFKTLEIYLAARYDGPHHHLKRVIVNISTLEKIWSGCPV